jgi:hypothetical protein
MIDRLFLLVTHLSQSFLPLVRCHLVSLAFFTTWHGISFLL